MRARIFAVMKGSGILKRMLSVLQYFTLHDKIRRAHNAIGCSTRRPRFGGRPPMVRNAFAGGADRNTHATRTHSLHEKNMLHDGQSCNCVQCSSFSWGQHRTRDANIERILARLYALNKPLIKIKQKLSESAQLFLSKKHSSNAA